MLSCFIAIKNLFNLSFTVYIIVKPANWERAFYIEGFLKGETMSTKHPKYTIPSFSVLRIT